MVDFTKIPPLDWQFPIVDPETGRPSPQFILLWQQLFGNTDKLVDTDIVGGTGIDVTGGLGDTVTITADIQESLNSISSTQGAVLYRNATDWVALPPGTSGQFLKTLGTAANPVWGTVTTDIQALLDGISTTQGVIIYYNGTDWVALAPGTSGHFLKTNGAAANPAWAAASTSSGANPTATASDTAVNGSATTFMRSDAAPAVQKGLSSQFGVVKVDGTSITSTAGVISAAAGASGANPTATASDTAVNGVATTFMRSDAAPAIQKTSSSQFGVSKVDGTTITAASGVISGATGANPTATASDTAVNGSASTFMRSDAAPAVQKATASVFGIVKVDGTTITASGGVITATGTGTRYRPMVDGSVPPALMYEVDGSLIMEAF